MLVVENDLRTNSTNTGQLRQHKFMCVYIAHLPIVDHINHNESVLKKLTKNIKSYSILASLC